MKREKKWWHRHTHTDDTHPSRTIVPDGICSIRDNKNALLYHSYRKFSFWLMPQISSLASQEQLFNSIQTANPKAVDALLFPDYRSAYSRTSLSRTMMRPNANLLEFTWINLNLLKFTWIYLNFAVKKNGLRTNGGTGGLMDQQTDGPMDRRTDGPMDGAV